MHGLRMGPDGRLYFSIGDRGFHVTSREGRLLARPDTGAVLRCEPDGSQLEVFAYGLRNPQELAFDDFGNLFTGDNNSDSGDKARWVYVVAGGDSGWRMPYQYLADRGPWNREKLWLPHFAGQAAYIIPPIANLGDGPAGLTHYPGVGLAERYQDHFFLVDFRGTVAISGVRSFAVQPAGASFTLADVQPFLWSVLATDVEFGYDGKLYVADWVSGWNGVGKGRIYTLADRRFAAAPILAETSALFDRGFSQRGPAELAKLLAHADQRVRLEAQFALAEQNAVEVLAKVAGPPEGAPLGSESMRRLARLARLHAIWGLGQIGRREPSALQQVVPLLQDADAEIRAQAAKVLGEGRLAGTGSLLQVLLDDDSPRVRFFAALGLRQHGSPAAIGPLLKLLAANDNRDPMLRHAAVLGLAGCGKVEAMLQASGQASMPARLGVLLALRQQGRPEVATFLHDPDRLLVAEAARAIHDLPIPAAMEALAALPAARLHAAAGQDEIQGRKPLLNALGRRVINANFRLGTADQVRAVGRLAADAEISESLRGEALWALLHWEDPPPLDRVLGAWQPLPPRKQGVVREALAPEVLNSLLAASDRLSGAAATLAGKHTFSSAADALWKLFGEAGRGDAVRVAALDALARLADPRTATLARQLLASHSAVLRLTARRTLARLEPQTAARLWKSALEQGQRQDTLRERQAALAALASLHSPQADTVLGAWLKKLIQNQVAAALQLDVVRAIDQRGLAAWQRRVAAWQARQSTGDPLAHYQVCLEGGDASRGHEVFFGHVEASCQRCHRIAGRGGVVGPDLTNVATDKSRHDLLESIVFPNRKIAKGFETTVLVLDSGKSLTGIVQADTPETLSLVTMQGERFTIRKEHIEAQTRGLSGMPEDLVKNFSLADLRDLVEYLSTLRAAASANP